MPISKNNLSLLQKGETYRAGCPSLGARLLVAAELVRPGRVVADIGCDHGKLAVYIALKKDVSKVIAADIRPLPLAKARALVKQNACEERVDCRLGDGLSCLSKGEAEDIIIAGMSGQTIQHIIESCSWATSSSVQFILIPTTRHSELRQWLCEAGFALQKEVAVRDNGRFYTVMSVIYTGIVKKQSPLFYTVGLLEQDKSMQAQGYIKRRLQHLEKRAKADLSEIEREELLKLTQEVAQCLE